jgi:hypothetical protein
MGEIGLLLELGAKRGISMITPRLLLIASTILIAVVHQFMAQADPSTTSG